jgi:signal transduction histidine kinase/uncharacterized protein YhfF
MDSLIPAPPAARDQRDLLRTIAEGTAGTVGSAFMRSLARCLAAAFEADIAYVAELTVPGSACVLAAWPGGDVLPEGYEYELAGTPCEPIAELDLISHPSGSVVRFPADGFLARHALEGYLAVPMRCAGGDLVGYVCVLSRDRLEAGDEEVAVLRIFAARAAAELDRRRHERLLRAREAEVAASRTRLVHAADEERRRIGRDLHDGAQQRLVALGQWIDLAARASDPEQVARFLAEAREQATEAGRELRELAHGLHPSGLAYGLGPALRGLGLRSPLPLRVVALPDTRLPEPVEVTIYYLVSEALSNAVKHAAATELQLRVERRGAALVAEVADDGAGGADAGAGRGLSGLRDRVDALGGRLEVESAPGSGTRLRASIPLAPWRDERGATLEFGFENDDGAGERAIAEILAGRKSVCVSPAREWDLEGGPPRIGQVLPVIDGEGRRRATVEVTRVAVLPFGQLDEDVVSAATLGVDSLAQWLADYRGLYASYSDEVALLLGEPGWRLTAAEPMVVTTFRLVEPAAPS